MDHTVFSVSEFVAMVNQTMEFSYPHIRIEGEVSEFKISKNRWVYFNLTDETSSVRMFGSVYQLKQPIEDGMKVVVKGTPRLHNKFGFSLNLSMITPSGEGSIKKAFELLKKKLAAEGLFSPERKRSLPTTPKRVGLITSAQAAAYSDFMEIVNQRWGGLEILHADVNVQGESAPAQIVRAIEYFSQMPEPVDVLVITRGGGSSEDLMAFSTEEVARAVAGSRVPTLVGVGHEVDVSLADMAADVRAATPTDAAQILVPDRVALQSQIDHYIMSIGNQLTQGLRERIAFSTSNLLSGMQRHVDTIQSRLEQYGQSLRFVNPDLVLKRGYSLVLDAKGKAIRDAASVTTGDELLIRLHKGQIKAEVTDAKER